MSYNDSVFINCPFDDAYKPLLRAIVFSVYRCGFIPKSALEEEDGTDNRLDKIIRLIKSCRYGIHDISRVELNAADLPRFNMPFELGIYFGAKRFGQKEQKDKSAIVFERSKWQYQQYLSDLNGVDPKAHDNNPRNIVRELRNWLSTESRRTTIPRTQQVLRDYDEFEADFPATVVEADFDQHTMTFSDLCLIGEEYVRVLIQNKTFS